MRINRALRRAVLNSSSTDIHCAAKYTPPDASTGPCVVRGSARDGAQRCACRDAPERPRRRHYGACGSAPARATRASASLRGRRSALSWATLIPVARRCHGRGRRTPGDGADLTFAPARRIVAASIGEEAREDAARRILPEDASGDGRRRNLPHRAARRPPERIRVAASKGRRRRSPFGQA